MFPILLFVTAIASFVMCLRTRSDVFALLGAATTLICLIWGLVIAHWSIHILALLALFFFVKPVAVATIDSSYK